ncbi:transcription elongation factor GreA [Rathayibacter iranicus]|uniref:transcription elongation factor GreA n=1 Tax=Rathayibacter iranicus TaxID=59737 RepID=UPI000CE7563D|nr:transcription elongation factor GreA [Rathayibacter iranicus]PPI47734.1 transcription elongation factor GreA [Rathayibacter iranicus]PPI73215.1 transcription elongation factor GreA [Rathayibacter iranicus]
MVEQSQVTWMTQESYDRLQAELTELSTAGREEIAKRIEVAREEGDLKENGGYHAAKDEQGKIEARIRQLTSLLREAEIGTPPESHGVVEAGTIITAEIAGDESRFLLGNREMAGESDLDVYSPQSPLGSAIMGLNVGDATQFTAPNGREIQVTVTNVETWSGH